MRRWRLGKRLREIREALGKTMDDAAAYLGVRRPTISRIENGRYAILPKNVKFLCQLYEVGAPEVDMLIRQAEETNERGWWASYSDTMPDWFETYIGFESDVSEIWTYESELVPGLLQVPSYVRAMRTAYQADVSELEIAKSVAFRLERQKRLESKPPVSAWCSTRQWCAARSATCPSNSSTWWTCPNRTSWTCEFSLSMPVRIPA